MRILHVDDDRSMRTLVDSFIKKTGIADLVSCGSKRDAERLLRDHMFDGAIIDLVLDIGNGFEIARLCFDKQIPVVFCTSANDEHNLKLMYKYGWVIPKPIIEESIIRSIEYFSHVKNK